MGPSLSVNLDAVQPPPKGAPRTVTERRPKENPRNAELDKKLYHTYSICMATFFLITYLAFPGVSVVVLRMFDGDADFAG